MRQTEANPLDAACWRTNVTLLSKGVIPLAIGDGVYYVRFQRTGMTYGRIVCEHDDGPRFAAWLSAQARRSRHD